MAQHLNEPFALAFSAAMIAATNSITRNLVEVLSYAEKAEKLCREFPCLRGMTTIYLGWARACMGGIDGATDAVRSALTEYIATGAYSSISHNLSLLAETQALSGKMDDALVTVDQALAANPDELWYRPLTLTLRGGFRLRRDPADESQCSFAERDFRDSIELSRKMRAKSPELRATMSLSRLLASRGRRDEARTMLAKIYNWFTEGFDTADLKEAKTLLDELSA